MQHGSERVITGFHQDEEGQWVAELECGHSRHFRHNPPWTLNEWVLTEEGRKNHLGRAIVCVLCLADAKGPQPDVG